MMSPFLRSQAIDDMFSPHHGMPAPAGKQDDMARALELIKALLNSPTTRNRNEAERFIREQERPGSAAR